MSDLKINNITDRTGGSGPVIAGVSTVSTTGAFTVPVGPTEFRGGRGIGLFSGGYLQGGGDYNTIEKVEIATTGNATDFGDLTAGRAQPGQGNLSNNIRGLFVGGYIPSPVSSDQNTIDYITFASTGNAKDFGDINRAANDSNRELGLCSDSHGGLTE